MNCTARRLWNRSFRQQCGMQGTRRMRTTEAFPRFSGIQNQYPKSGTVSIEDDRQKEEKTQTIKNRWMMISIPQKKSFHTVPTHSCLRRSYSTLSLSGSTPFHHTKSLFERKRDEHPSPRACQQMMIRPAEYHSTARKEIFLYAAIIVTTALGYVAFRTIRGEPLTPEHLTKAKAEYQRLEQDRLQQNQNRQRQQMHQASVQQPSNHGHNPQKQHKQVTSYDEHGGTKRVLR